MNINERILFHEEQREKLHDEKEDICNRLNRVNEKLIYHWAAIQNLVKKKVKPKKEDI